MGWAVGAAFALWLAHMFAARRLLFTYNVRRLPSPEAVTPVVRQSGHLRES